VASSVVRKISIGENYEGRTKLTHSDISRFSGGTVVRKISIGENYEGRTKLTHSDISRFSGGTCANLFDPTWGFARLPKSNGRKIVRG
jgi:hypothetical protein